MVVIQGLFGLVVLTMPGVALLSIASRWRLPQWPFAFTLAASFVLSSLLIAGLQTVSLTLLRPSVSRLAAWLFVLTMLFYVCRTGWKSAREAYRPVGIWERFSIAIVAAIVLLWLSLMPLSPYPSQISVGLGDPPGYYRAAANLVAGRGWAADYFVGDYVGSTLSYITAQPILVLITTLFFQIFGANGYSLYVYDAVAAGVLIYLLASLVCLTPKATVVDGRHILWLTAAISLAPTHFILFGLGIITAPGALAFLTATAFWISQVAPTASRYFIVAASAILLFWVRPEALLLAILLVAFCGVSTLLTIRQISQLARSTLLVGCLAASVALWVNLPTLVDVLPAAAKGLAVSYLKFDSVSGRFAPMYDPWWQLNRQLSRANFLDEGAVESIANASIGWELRAHPVSFLRYLLDRLPSTSLLFARAVSLPEIQSYGRFFWLGEMTALVILGTLLVLAAIDSQSRPIVAAITGFLLLLPLLNLAADVRHVLIVSPVIVGLSLRSVLRQLKSSKPRGLFAVFPDTPKQATIAVMLAVILILLLVDSVTLIRIRTDRANQSYVNILHDIEAITSPDDVVASSYPQLITCVTGRRSIGATWLTENIELIIRKYHPDFILVDNARDGVWNYTLLEKNGLTIPGYVPVIHNRTQNYVIFRSVVIRPKADATE